MEADKTAAQLENLLTAVEKLNELDAVRGAQIAALTQAVELLRRTLESVIAGTA